MPKTTIFPWCAAGTNGIGGQFMTFAMVESSSGAASDRAMNPATTSGVPGSMSMPPTTWSSGCRRYQKRVATPKVPPPPRIAQKRSG